MMNGHPSLLTPHTLSRYRLTFPDINHVEGLIPKEFGANAAAIPGAQDLLEALENVRAPWLVVTSGTHALASGWLDVLHLVQPSIMITAEDVKVGKPGQSTSVSSLPMTLSLMSRQILKATCWAEIGWGWAKTRRSWWWRTRRQASEPEKPLVARCLVWPPRTGQTSSRLRVPTGSCRIYGVYECEIKAVIRTCLRRR